MRLVFTLATGLKLLEEARALIVGIVELGESVGNLHAGHKSFKPLHHPRVIRALFRQG